jgi:chaperonin GroES
MNIKPLSDHLVLQPLDAETTTSFGIIIPDTVSKERPEKAKVVAIGPGKMQENGQRRSIEVTLGQTVLFKKYATDEVSVDGQDYLIVKADDVIAIIE